MISNKNFEDYIDKWGCIVTRLAVNKEEHHVDQEDSMHKAGHLMYWRRYPQYYLKLHIYIYNTVKVMRHPMSRYSVSRDQLLPFAIGFSKTSNEYSFLHYCRHCVIEKDEYKWLNTIRKLYLHTSNGDMFQPHHKAALLRTERNLNIFNWVSIILGDLFACLVSVFMLFIGNDKHNVNLVQLLHYNKSCRPTIFSRLAWIVYLWRHDPIEEYRMYFDNAFDPPIHKLVEDRLK
jgi:hypothetical protein